MTEVAVTRTVPATREAIWDVLADFAALAEWASDIDHASLLHEPGDTLVGTTRRVQTGRTTLLERIVQADAPAELAYVIEGLPALLGHVENRWRLSVLDATSTQVTLITTIDPGTRPPRRLVARIAARRIAAVDAMLLDGLCAHLEGTRGD